jgi:hypothetical protein
VRAAPLPACRGTYPVNGRVFVFARRQQRLQLWVRLAACAATDALRCAATFAGAVAATGPAAAAAAARRCLCLCRLAALWRPQLGREPPPADVGRAAGTPGVVSRRGSAKRAAAPAPKQPRRTSGRASPLASTLWQGASHSWPPILEPGGAPWAIVSSPKPGPAQTPYRLATRPGAGPLGAALGWPPLFKCQSQVQLPLPRRPPPARIAAKTPARPTCCRS